MSTKDLTEAEQGAISLAFALCGGTGNLSPLFAAVDDIVTAREADAWDQGVGAAHRSPLTLFAIKQVNPHREREAH